MVDEKFGSVFVNERIFDIDTAKIEDLEKISKELEEKEEKLKNNAKSVFNQ